MREFFGITSNFRFLIVLLSSIRVSEAARWGPNLNLPRSGPFQNSSTALSMASISSDTTATQRELSNSEPPQYFPTASITNPTSNGTQTALPNPSLSGKSQNSSSTVVKAPTPNDILTGPQIPSISGALSSFSAVRIPPTSDGNITATRQGNSTSESFQNSSAAITQGPKPNGTATTRPTPTTSSHAITSPPVVFPFSSNVSFKASLSIPQKCFNLGFVYLHPEWVGNQTVPDNTCSQITTDSAGVICPAWSSCTVDVGSVQLVYFPTTSNNVTHPSTLYDPKYNYTFTSPSVYGVWTKINGWNECNGVTNAPLGFSLTNVIQAFDITEIRSSLYWGSTTSMSDGKVQTIYSWEQLHLSDLYSDCPTSFASQPTPASSTAPHVASNRQFPSGHKGSGPVPSEYRCNPQLAIPLIATQEGWPWWRDCGLDNGFNGMPDPPYALSFSKNPFPSDNGQPVSSALPGPGPAGIPSLNQAPSTAPVQSANPPGATANPGSPQPNKVVSPQPVPSNGNNSPGASSDPTQNSQAANPTPGATSLQGQQSGQPQSSGQPQGQQPGQSSSQGQPSGPQSQSPQNQPPQNQQPSQPITAVSIALIGTDVISALPPATNNGAPTAAAILLPSGSTLLPGSAATVPANDGSGHSVVVSAPAAGENGNGNLVISTLGSSSAGTYNVDVALSKGNADAGVPGAFMTVAGLDNAVLSYGQGGVALQNQGGAITTLSPGGPALTIGSQSAVLSYASTGVVVQYPGGGISTLVAPSPVVTAVGSLVTTVAALGNAVLSYGPSGVMVKSSDGGSTTLTVGGPAITLGSNTILSYGPSGAVVKYSGGQISTLAAPTPAPAASSLITTIAALDNAVLSYGASGVVVKGPGGSPTTLSIAGPGMTLGSNTVLSYGPSGVVVQYPGGSVSTITPAGSSNTGPGVGPLINSIINGASMTAGGGSSGSGSGQSVSGSSAKGTGGASGGSSTAGSGGGSGRTTSLPPVVVKGDSGRIMTSTWYCVLATFFSLVLAGGLT